MGGEICSATQYQWDLEWCLEYTLQWYPSSLHFADKLLIFWKHPDDTHYKLFISGWSPWGHIQHIKVSCWLRDNIMTILHRLLAVNHEQNSQTIQFLPQSYENCLMLCRKWGCGAEVSWSLPWSGPETQPAIYVEQYLSFSTSSTSKRFIMK